MTDYANNFEIFSRTKKNHNAFHSILNKYIPENPSSQQRGDLLDHLSSLNEEQKRGYYLRAMEKAYDEFKGQINDDSRDHYLNFMDQVSDKLTDQINIDLTIGVDDVIPFE